jgi:hypothetical protein
MNLTELRHILDEKLSVWAPLDRQELLDDIESLTAIYPFNDYEYLASHLIAASTLSIGEYRTLRQEYIAQNMFLPIIEIAGPRPFGETWAQSHIISLDHRIIKPTSSIDPSYRGHYDVLALVAS